MSPLFLQAKSPESSRTLVSFLEQNWPALLGSGLGLLAVYLLLPRVRRYPWALGTLAGVVALVLAGSALLCPEPIWVESVLFYVFAGLAVLFGGLMITQVQPVRAALSFAMVVLSTCGLFLLQAAPFLMAATIIIYAGAIVVTFLFVIMLAQQSGLDNADYRTREPFLACVAGFVLLAAILCVLQRDYRVVPKYADALAHIDAHLRKQKEAEPETRLIADEAELRSRIDTYVMKLGRAAKTSTPQHLKDQLGDESFVKDFKNLIKPLEGSKDRPNYKNFLHDKLNNLEEAMRELFDPLDSGVDKAATEVRKLAQESYVLAWRLKNELDGTLLLQPNETLPLSDFSGAKPNQLPSVDEHGRARMPADNVAALGKSLFTDYLVSVELAATLLLVATIGAIVIAGRRTGGLK
jgi:NADH:ubiquinone oxidoreductase subunit 6 (subunit J)